MNPRNFGRDETLEMVAKMNPSNGGRERTLAMVEEMNPINGGREGTLAMVAKMNYEKSLIEAKRLADDLDTTTVKYFDIPDTKKVTKRCSECGVTI